MKRHCVCVVISFAVLALCAMGGEYFVSPRGSDVTGNGSMGNPWATISKAIASVSGSAADPAVIKVAKGTYLENIVLKQYVHLLGGYDDETSYTRNTQRFPSTLKSPNPVLGDRIVEAADNSIIDGFTLRAGFWAIHCYNASPEITNNSIEDNSSHGIMCEASSAPTIRFNTIQRNKIGAVFFNSAGTVERNIVQENTEQGIYCSNSSPAIIENSVHNNNTAGIYVTSASSPKIERNFVGRNLGNGVEAYSASPSLLNNVIALNEDGLYARRSGGTTAVNNTIYGNRADGVLLMEASPLLVNNIIAKNHAYGVDETDSTSDPSVTYNCFFENAAGDYLDEGSEVISGAANVNALVNNGSNPCQNNLGGDPAFLDVLHDNFHLTEASSCIDAATTGVANSLDLDAQARPYDVPGIDRNGDIAEVDVGADEFCGTNYLGFEPGSEGWQFRTAYPSFSAPFSSLAAGQLRLRSVVGNTFGYWESPTSMTVALENYVYRFRYHVLTDQPDATKVPGLRIRANNENFQVSAFVSVDSNGDAANSPATTAKPYDLYYLPFQGEASTPSGQMNVLSSFDLLNFNPLDDPNAALTLETVEVSRCDFGSIQASLTDEAVYEFDTSTQGWSFITVSPVFGEPSSGHSSGALSITATNNENNFGYWLSPALAVAPNQLYCATFNVSTDVTDRARCPSMRLRLNTVNAQMASVLNVDSVGGGEASPSAQKGLDYYLFFAAPANAAADGMVASFDLLNFDSNDSPNGTFYVERVTISKTLAPLD
jgi:parallel beta-helix repeat protein